MEGARDTGEHDVLAGRSATVAGSGPSRSAAAPSVRVMRGPAGPASEAPPWRWSIVQQIIELAEPALLFDLRPKPRGAGARIAFECGNGGVLVLDHAGNGAERPVGEARSGSHSQSC